MPIGEPWRDTEDPEPKPVPGQATEGGVEGKGGGESVDGKGREEMKTGTAPVEVKEFQGDCMLARSAAFMYEALVSKEVAQAVAEGDVGRVYKGIKVRI